MARSVRQRQSRNREIVLEPSARDLLHNVPRGDKAEGTGHEAGCSVATLAIEPQTGARFPLGAHFAILARIDGGLGGINALDTERPFAPGEPELGAKL